MNFPRTVPIERSRKFRPKLRLRDDLMKGARNLRFRMSMTFESLLSRGCNDEAVAVIHR